MTRTQILDRLVRLLSYDSNLRFSEDGTIDTSHQAILRSRINSSLIEWSKATRQLERYEEAVFTTKNHETFTSVVLWRLRYLPSHNLFTHTFTVGALSSDVPFRLIEPSEVYLKKNSVGGHPPLLMRATVFVDDVISSQWNRINPADLPSSYTYRLHYFEFAPSLLKNTAYKMQVRGIFEHPEVPLSGDYDNATLLASDEHLESIVLHSAGLWLLDYTPQIEKAMQFLDRAYALWSEREAMRYRRAESRLTQMTKSHREPRVPDMGDDSRSYSRARQENGTEPGGEGR